MKKMIFVLLALVMVFAFVGTASALTTGNNETNTWNPAGPTYAFPGASAVATPSAQRGGAEWTAALGSPHQGYLSTTNKCEVCHSPHRAGNNVSVGGTSFKLLYGTTAASGATGSCLVCHVASSLAIKDVYDTTAAPVRGGHDLAAMTGGVPDSSWATANASLGCSDCHTVHGAGAILFAGVKVNILRANPTWNSVAAGAPMTATTMTSFCDACHDLNYSATTNGITHYMGAANAAGSTGGAARVLSTITSADCSNCHAAPVSTDTKDLTAAKWPHQSVSIVGLGTGSSGLVTSQDAMDNHCLKCHGSVGTAY